MKKHSDKMKNTATKCEVKARWKIAKIEKKKKDPFINQDYKRTKYISRNINL